MSGGAADWYLSEMANGIERSRILSIATDVRKLKEDGKEVTAFTVGDFSPEHFAVPSRFIDELSKAVKSNETNYPPAAGLPELRKQLADWMTQKYRYNVEPEGVIVGSGARPVLYASFRLFLSPGEGLAHGVPAWNNHYYVHLNDAVGIPIKGTSESRFLPTAEAIKERISDIRVLILNSPLNPTGTCFSKEELTKICDVIIHENNRRRNNDEKPLMLVYDQVYSTMTANGVEHHHPVALRPEMFDYTITLDAISKSLSATGLRLGWMTLPPKLAAPVVALIGHMGAWPARPIQIAASKTYESHKYLEDFFTELDSKIEQRMNILFNRLSEMKNRGIPVDFIPPQGGIYLSTRFNLFNLLGVETNEEIREWLLEMPGIAVIPFQAFGLMEDTGWFRISIGAVSCNEISAAMDRLESSLNELASN